jgi:hypothetical protein
VPISPFKTAAVPLLGAPVKVLGTTILVVVECLQCAGREQMALVNDQKTVCPSCGAVVNLNHVTWDKAMPSFTASLNATNTASATVPMVNLDGDHDQPDRHLRSQRRIGCDGRQRGQVRDCPHLGAQTQATSVTPTRSTRTSRRPRSRPVDVTWNINPTITASSRCCSGACTSAPRIAGSRTTTPSSCARRPARARARAPVGRRVVGVQRRLQPRRSTSRPARSRNTACCWHVSSRRVLQSEVIEAEIGPHLPACCRRERIGMRVPHEQAPEPHPDNLKWHQDGGGSTGTTRHIVVWASEQPTETQDEHGEEFGDSRYESVMGRQRHAFHRQPRGTNEQQRWFVAIRCSGELI